MAQAEIIKKRMWLEENGHDYARYSFMKCGKVRWRAQYTPGMAQRKFMEAATEEALIERLYEYYMTQDGVYITLEQALEQEIQHRSEIKPIKGETIERLYYKKNFWQGLFNRRLQDLTADDLRKYINSVASNYTRNALKEAIQLMHNAYSLAIERDQISLNVGAKVQFRDWAYVCKAPMRNAKDKTFTPREIADIIQKARSWQGQRQRDKSHLDMRIYALLLEIVTGMRVGELVSLRWEDVHWTDEYGNPQRGYIHVHRQQLEVRQDKHRVGFQEVNYTKNERGYSQGGRKVPFLMNARELLEEIYRLTGDGTYVLEIDGRWITADNYQLWLTDRQREWGYSVTNNHAFRIALNNNVLIPNGFNLNQRSAIMGHTEEVNLRNYTYYRDDQFDEIQDLAIATQTAPVSFDRSSIRLVAVGE